MNWSVVKADALEFLRARPPGSLDLVFGSPPYTDARLYLEAGRNLGISRGTDEWVAWMLDVYRAALAACKGLVAFVVEDRTDNFRYGGGPVLLWADLIRSGVTTRKAPLYHRRGIMGGGGPDWLRNDYEFIICATNGGRLPWSDNTACGEPPKYQPGGNPSNRTKYGRRVNETCVVKFKKTNRAADKQWSSDELQYYSPPDVANPGNVIKCTVGGGHMGGDAFTRQNEAPFPEKLAEFFVRSFAPPGGVVCDPFSGSGTTAVVAKRYGRNFVGCDLRRSQVDLSLKRLATETPPLFTEAEPC